MIVFDLKCLEGHVFEAWFASSGAYEEQRDRRLIQCPVCGAEEVEKAIMAPRVGAKGNQAASGPAEMVSSDPAAVKTMLASMAEAQKQMLENSDFVGDRFADEARAIHLGEAANRSIHGRATREETESLREDGISVAPLPFPVAEPGRQH